MISVTGELRQMQILSIMMVTLSLEDLVSSW